MKKLNDFFEKHFIPFAVKLNNIKGLIAIRDAFIQIFPLTFVGSIAVCINCVVFNSTGFIGQLLISVIPELDKYQDILSPIQNGTINIMAIFIVFLIAKNMARQHHEDETKTGLIALAVFFTLYPPKTDNMLTDSYLGANGLFVAIFIGLLVGYLFSKLSKNKKLHIKMPAQVPPEVANSFRVVIPSSIIIFMFAIVAYIIHFFEPEGINTLLYNILKSPIQLIGTSPITPLILILIAMILWSVGIHGTFTVQPIHVALYSALNVANLQYAAQAGTVAGSPYPITWFTLFENYGCIGGTGNTLALIVAILILSKKSNWKRDDYTKTAKLSLIPGLFCINEPIIFGMPIVLNPILIVPFILSPLISMGIGALLISSGTVLPGTLDVGWTTPQPIKAFLSAGGSLGTALSVIIVFIICVLIYLPFVNMANKQTLEKEENK